MSQADVERFVQDLKSKPDLLDEVKAGAGGVASVVEIAKRNGYDVSVDEARAYIRSQSSKDLTDDQLEAVAGGKHHSSTGTSTVQTQTVATTTTEAAEVETGVVVVAEGALVFT